MATLSGIITPTNVLTAANTVTLTNKTIAYADNTLTGVVGTTATQTLTNKTIQAGIYSEAYAALSGTTPAVNCSTGNIFSLTTSGNTTFTFTNVPTTGIGYGFTLKLTAGGTHTLTWPASVDWPGGAAPSAPASGATNVYVFITYDGGTIWYGFLGGAALA